MADPQGRVLDESFEAGASFADDFDATIVGEEFAIRENYKTQEGENPILFILKLGDCTEDLSGVQNEVSFSIGKGWEIVLGGQGVDRVDSSKPRKFAANSLMYKLIQRTVQLYPDLPTRGQQRSDRIGLFTGTRWHWNLEKPDFGGGSNRITNVRDHLMPTKFIGLGSGASAGAGAGAGAGAASGVSDADAILAELNALAIEHEKHSDYLKAITTNPSLSARVKAQGPVFLQTAMSAKPEGIYHKTRSDMGLPIA